MKIVVSDEAALHAQRAYDGKAGYSRLERLRAALEAAAPYLESADMCHNGHPFRPGEDTDMEFEGRSPDPTWCNVCGEARRVGDGGLREALEKLAHEWRVDADNDEKYLQRAGAPEIHQVAAEVRMGRLNAQAIDDVLAAHPAAPAVPLPVDREALAEVLHESFPSHSHKWERCPSVHRNPFYWQADAVLALLGGSAGEQVEP